MNEQRMEAIRERLATHLQADDITVQDDSHLHVGHAGARDGRGHFTVRVVSPAFSGLSRLQRHQKVFDAVGDLMKTDIHALRVKALTPEEASSKKSGP